MAHTAGNVCVCVVVESVLNRFHMLAVCVAAFMSAIIHHIFVTVGVDLRAIFMTSQVVCVPAILHKGPS